MNAIEQAMLTLVNDPNMGVDLLYRVQGNAPDIPLRGFRQQPDLESQFADTRARVTSTIVEVRQADIAQPSESDTVIYAGVLYRVGSFEQDEDRIFWRLDLKAVG